MEDLTEEPEASAPEGGDPDLARDLERVGEDGMPQPLPLPPLAPDSDVTLDLSAEPEGGDPDPTDEGDEKGADEEENGKGDDDDHPATLWIDKSLLARVNQVFVEPPEYDQSRQEQRERILHSHVFILHGEEHAGKLTCALHLAQNLLGRRG